MSGNKLLTSGWRPVFVVVDDHPAHKAKRVREFVESTNGMLKLLFLPPYSPHLNPDEQVWAHVKRDVSRRGVQNIEQMKRVARSASTAPAKATEFDSVVFPSAGVPICTDLALLPEWLVSGGNHGA